MVSLIKGKMLTFYSILMINFQKILTRLLDGFQTLFVKLIKIINSLKYNLPINVEVKLISLTYTRSLRCLTFHFANTNLKDSKEVLRNIFNILMNNERFLTFGSNKVIIITGVVNNNEYSFHHNVLINNDTLFEDYYEQVKDYIDLHFNNDYYDS
jgi:hypothetical protein